jgi:hypothetical protein
MICIQGDYKGRLHRLPYRHSHHLAGRQRSEGGVQHGPSVPVLAPASLTAWFPLILK